MHTGLGLLLLPEKLEGHLLKYLSSQLDGTTTATVLAYAMVKEGLKNVAAGANPISIKLGMEKAPVSSKTSIAKQHIYLIKLLLVPQDPAPCIFIVGSAIHGNMGFRYDNLTHNFDHCLLRLP